MTTSRGITDTRVYDRQGVIDRYGIPPELIPDFIGLKGDTSDNIPGVPGIGDKTAAELLQRFGTLEDVLKHIDDISGAKRKQNLTEHADAARLSKGLATAKRDIDVELDLQAFAGGCARPLAAAGHLPEVRAPRAAAPARGGARLRRRRRAGAEAEEALSARVRAANLNALKGLPDKPVALAVRAPQAPEGVLFAPTPSGASGYMSTARPRCSRARPIAQNPSWRRWRAVPSRRTTRNRSARCPRRSPRHRGRRLPARAGSPRLPVPRAHRGARPRHRPGRRRGRGRAPDHRARRVAARRDPRARAHRPVPGRRAPPRARSCARWSWRARTRHRPTPRDLRAGQGRGRRARARDLRPVRRGVHARLAQAARRGPVRQTRPVA